MNEPQMQKLQNFLRTLKVESTQYAKSRLCFQSTIDKEINYLGYF